MYYSSCYTCNLGEPKQALQLSLLRENRCFYVCVYVHVQYVSVIHHPQVVLAKYHFRSEIYDCTFVVYMHMHYIHVD